MANQFTELNHLVKLIDPVADAFDGAAVYTDVINMARFGHATAVVHCGVGATGTSVVTAEACDNANGDNPVAIPFRYRETLSGDTPGALTYVAATGFTMTAGSSKLVALEVDSQLMAGTKKSWLRWKFAESVNSPVLGGVLGILSEPKFAAPFETAIA